jgi:molecular chaperone GrpE
MKTDQSDNTSSENNEDFEERESVNNEYPLTENQNLEDPAEQEDLSPTELLKTELEDANNKYIRLYAEFDNYKRRTSRERVELLQTAGKDVIVDLLPVLDDLERALKAIDDHANDTSVKEGIQLVFNKLKKTLQQKGLKEMESINQPFDADFHEAVTNIPAPSDDMKGKVIDEIVKGYLLNDKVLRYAKVVVGS